MSPKSTYFDQSHLTCAVLLHVIASAIFALLPSIEVSVSMPLLLRMPLLRPDADADTIFPGMFYSSRLSLGMQFMQFRRGKAGA